MGNHSGKNQKAGEDAAVVSETTSTEDGKQSKKQIKRGKRKSINLEETWKIFDEDPEVVNDEKIEKVADELVEKGGIPGACCGIVVMDKESLSTTIRLGCAGNRQADVRKNFVQEGDKWHLGSCTKAVTATIAARFIAEGAYGFTWETTISQTLGKKLKGVHRGYHNCSLLNLMTHTSGIDAHPGTHIWTTAWGMTELHPSVQRHKYATAILSQKPTQAIGQYLYSNSNYAVLGCILEVVSGHSFDELVMSLIAKPLGISTAGVGPAGSKEKDKSKAKANPWGHDAHKNPQDPHKIQSDNPDAIAPAGKLHMSMGDWGRFVSVHMHPKLLHRLVSYDGEDSTSEEDKSPFNVLHQPISSRPKSYACGWSVTKHTWAGSAPVLGHSGSNTMNYCRVLVSPEKGFAVMIACNIGSKSAKAPSQHAQEQLIKLARNYLRRTSHSSGQRSSNHHHHHHHHHSSNHHREGTK